MLAAATLAFGWPSAAGSIELMTADGYLLALSQDEASRKAAVDYVTGTLDTLIVVNEVAAGDDEGIFCLSDERASVLDTGLLRDEFTDWLRTAPRADTLDQDSGALPVSVLGLAFLSGKFPCASDAAASAPGAGADAVRARLLDALPE